MRSHTLTVNAHPFPSVYCFFPLSLSVLVLVFLRGGNSSILNYVFFASSHDDDDDGRHRGNALNWWHIAAPSRPDRDDHRLRRTRSCSRNFGAHVRGPVPPNCIPLRWREP